MRKIWGRDMAVEHIPPPIAEAVAGGGLAVMWSAVGRMMYHARQAQQGRRHLFDKRLLWELPVAIGMGIIGQGVAQHFNLQGWVSTAVIVTLGYMGPGFAEAVVWRVLDKVLPEKKDG